MKVFHEAPICFLEYVQNYTDGEYILPHLLDENEDYKNYMLEAKEKGRYIIMDNSLHELGKPYDEDRLLYWLNELKPDEFIVPDLWENAVGTMDLARKWIVKDIPKNTTKVVVIQATSIEEAYHEYIWLKAIGYKKLAFSYGASYYCDLFKHPNKDFSRALGRLFLISKFYQDKTIQEGDRIHLLGCSIPQEFSWYKGIPIESIDTSNPVMAAIEGKIYREYGLLEKPKTNMNKVVNNNFSDYLGSVIIKNIIKFKQINGL